MEGVAEEVSERKRTWQCRDVDQFQKLNDISEGAYGVVSRGQDKTTGAMVALKRLKMDRLGKGELQNIEPLIIFFPFLSRWLSLDCFARDQCAAEFEAQKLDRFDGGLLLLLVK